MQCGYCTAGMIMSAVALLSRLPDPTEEQIVRGMNGNVCRCGSHPRVVDAIRAASSQASFPRSAARPNDSPAAGTVTR